MATTYPLTTLAPTISASGITAPPYSDILQSLQASYRTIFGADVYIAPDSQDGQMLAVFAKALADSNDAMIALFNSYSPATAQGTNLSNAVKINGISRLVSSKSQVNLLIGGTVGATINNGVVKDTNGKLWNLPGYVVIPGAGSVLVTATAQEAGAIPAAIGTVTSIQTPTLGWQTVTNPAVASLGSIVETDAMLRARQASATSLPALSTLASIVASLQSITGVTQVAAYENDTNFTDSNGIPAHAISLVVAGGASASIAASILAKKSPGTSTYGTTTVATPDASGVNRNVNYYQPTPKTITVAVSLHPLTGYTTAIGVSIQTAVANYISALLIGQPVYRDRLFLPAQLYGNADSATFNVTAIQIAVSPGAVASSDLTLAFNEQAVCAVGNVTLTLV